MGLTNSRKGAELFHHAQSVPIGIGIHDFPAREVVDGHSFDGDFPICWWNAHEIAFVGAGKRPAGNHFILLGNGVFDGEAQIREAREEAQYLAFVRFRAD